MSKEQSFQVNTEGRPVVKRFLKQLFIQKYGNVAFSCEDLPSQPYLIFVPHDAAGVGIGNKGIYHNDIVYNPETCPVVSLMEAIARLTAPIAKKKSVLLNEEYTAEVTEGEDVVNVGCQKIKVSAIRELVAVLDEFKL